MTNVRKNLIATLDPGEGTTPLLVDLVNNAHGVFVGIAVSGCALVGSGGTAPYTFSIVAGDLPDGLSLDSSTGQITGTPSTQGISPFSAQIADSASNVFTRTFTIKVIGQLFRLQVTPTPAVRSVPYRYQILMADAAGSTSGVSYSITNGSLPTGITMSSGGLLSGTPTGTAGTYYFEVTGSLSGSTLEVPMSLILWNALTSLSGSFTVPAELKKMTVGIPVNASVSFNNGGAPLGYAPYTWSITSGALPAGLKMDASGRVTGTPTTPTTPTYVQPTFTITDKAGITRNFTPSGSDKLSVSSSVGVGAGPGRVFMTDVNGLPTDIDYLSVFFGDGSDGDVTISSGTTTLDRDMYYDNLTIDGTGQIFVSAQGWDIYVAGVLDLTNAPQFAIHANGGPAAVAGPYATAGGSGGAGAASAGGVGSDTLSVSVGGGGIGGIGGGGGGPGDGGSGSSGAGGASGISGGVSNVVRNRPFTTYDIFSQPSVVSPVGAGAGGGGGGGGGGTGLGAGGNGGNGGGGGGRLRIFARTINRGASTAAGAISARGGGGSNGTAGASTGRGGGGGGLGGGGGFIRIVYVTLTGSTATNAINAGGGTGGNGGNSGGGTATAGKGGSGGYGGAIILNNLTAPSTTVVEGSAGSVNSGQTGGAGGTCVSDL
jgi:hypothetical protein